VGPEYRYHRTEIKLFKKDKIVKNCNSSRLPWVEVKGAAAHSLGTTGLALTGCVLCLILVLREILYTG